MKIGVIDAMIAVIIVAVLAGAILTTTKVESAPKPDAALTEIANNGRCIVYRLNDGVYVRYIVVGGYGGLDVSISQ